MNLSIVILAAGQGKRMYSTIPKPLHCLGGLPMIEHVILAAQKLEPKNIIVVHGDACLLLKEKMAHLDVKWAEQKDPKGTGHAVLQALPFIPENHFVLVLCGDVPLVNPATLKELIQKTKGSSIGWITASVTHPSGLGRIIRDKNRHLIAIAEEKDATKTQKAIHEINTGICLVPAKFLKAWLPKLKTDNSQGEYYLTDILNFARKEGIKIHTVSSEKEAEILGVNNRLQLAQLERIYQRNLADNFMLSGLTLIDPNRFDIRGHLTFGKDVMMDVNVIIEGTVKIGSHCYIGPNVILRNATLGDHVHVDENSVIQDSIIGSECKIGPFARLRPGTQLGNAVKIGNFVETKNATIGHHSKVNHLSYMGDVEIGKNVNVGAGSITCNYDGVHKHKTMIGDEAFIGSDTKFVAPVKIGSNATIGAGSVITEDAPAEKLTLARTKQITIDHWTSPKEKIHKKE